MKKITITLVCLLMTKFSCANPGSWIPASQKISTIIIENGKALIVLEGGIPSTYIPPECNSPYNQADLSTEHGKGIYSMALAAQLAGKKVSMALSCSGSRPFITHFKLDV